MDAPRGLLQGEKSRFELHKNDTYYFEQILKEIPNKVAAVQPLTPHLKNHPSKTYKPCRTLLEKQGRTHK